MAGLTLRGVVVSRCKVYEIQGPDASRTSSAQRCHWDATGLAVVGTRVVAVCARHDGEPWELWELFGGKGGWLYAVNVAADVPAEKNKKKSKKRRK